MDVNEVVSKLENAVKADAATTESSTVEKETVATDQAKTDSGKRGTAQDRIQELVADRKAIEDKLKATEEKLNLKDQEVHNLIESVKQREGAARVVDKINSLYSQGKFKSEIEALDAAIKGVEQEAEEIQSPTEMVKVPVNTDLQKFQVEAERSRQEALSAIEVQKNELLLMKSQLITEKLFAALPEEEYNDQDLKVLQNALVDHVDWEAIESNPTALEAKIAEGFQNAVSWYGDPRGKLSTQTTKVTGETKAETKEPVDFSKLEWGKLEKDTKGKMHPVASDNEFAAALAEEMRKAEAKRQGR